MLSNLLQPLRFLVRAILAETTPHQLALGFAVGAAIGLVPKMNLIAVGLIALLFVLRVNLLSGAVGILVFSVISQAMTPFLDRIGEAVLMINFLQPLYGWLYDAPLGAWTRFNNTVVAGGLLIGLVQLYPLYHIMKGYVAKRLDHWSSIWQRTEMGQALVGSGNGGSVPREKWRIG